MKRIVSFLTLTAVALPLQAQGEVVGLTATKPVVHTITTSAGSTCKVVTCTPNPAFEKRATANPWAGGTAYDGRIGGVWVTNGLQIAAVDPRNKCDYLVKPQNMPRPSSSAVCTGLAFVESGAPVSSTSQGTMFASYVDGRYGQLARITVTVTSGTYSFKPVYCSRFPMPLGYRLSGLATDDTDLKSTPPGRMLFVAMSKFGTTSPDSVITVTFIDGPDILRAWCLTSLLCQFKVPSCPGGRALGPIQGLAFDPCKKILYITDGRMTMWGTFTRSSTGCSFKLINCCTHTGSNLEPLTGLSFMPKRKLSVGNSCTVRPCNPCEGVMQAGSIGGDTVLGNTGFALTLRNAPSNATQAILGLGFGPCSSSGVPIGLCGSVKVFLGPPPMMVWFFGMRPTGAGCTGSLTVPAKIPLSQSACGVKASVQWAVQCKTASSMGHGMTNCLTFEINS